MMEYNMTDQTPMAEEVPPAFPSHNGRQIVLEFSGSIGIQVSKPVGTIEVKGLLSTCGSEGGTLVKGVIMTLPANGVSVKPGGVIQKLILAGGIVTNGDNVTSFEIEGEIGEISIQGDIAANGLDSTGVAISAGGQPPLSHVSVLSKHGVAVRIGKLGTVTYQNGLVANGAKSGIIEE